MRILFGVQGTGNGHLTRARLLVTALRTRGLHVDVLLSGRAPDRWPDDPWCRGARRYRGLTFVTRDGRVDRWLTLRSLRPFTTLAELRSVWPERHDLVITDYEPLSAWAARLAGVPCIGIGHQYAFAHPVPRPDDDPIGVAVMRRFAPARNALGLHWHPFDAPILPPMIDHSLARCVGGEPYTLVYRPFEDTRALLALLQRLPTERFELFAPDAPTTAERHGNVRLQGVTREAFRHALLGAQRVVCSTGFTLISEALHLGLPVLTRPVAGQYEQRANALALERLGVATVRDAPLGETDLRAFLERSEAGELVRFPDVAAAIADEIARTGSGVDTAGLDAGALAGRLWARVETRHESWRSLGRDPVAGKAVDSRAARPATVAGLRRAA